ncbi:hypothetical protein O181_069787 [Austropuccinia psidii MF-1]|uniref:Uncharacterized protein n=1 Tax=Austropuccinia psidii MF-1 TaxID=1389203 RepID=A0A9Q3F4T0_9BASI|nr:hypothetical protein [Austropuccinia psidii MF-1]
MSNSCRCRRNSTAWQEVTLINATSMPLGVKGCLPPQSSLEDVQGADVLVHRFCLACTDADELTYACVQSKCNKGKQARFKNCTIPGSTKSLTGQIITPLVFTAFTQYVASGIDSSGKQISNARCEPSSNPAPGSRPTCGECYVASFATLIRPHCDEQLRRL